MAVSTLKSDSAGRTNLNAYIAYAKRNGIVQVDCRVSGSSSLTPSGVTLGTLPSGFRPSASIDFAGTALGGTEAVFFRVTSNGVVTGFASTNTQYWSGSFSFIAD